MDVKGVGKEEAVFIQGENGNALVISHWTAVVFVGPSMIHVIYQY